MRAFLCLLAAYHCASFPVPSPLLTLRPSYSPPLLGKAHIAHHRTYARPRPAPSLTMQLKPLSGDDLTRRCALALFAGAGAVGLQAASTGLESPGESGRVLRASEQNTISLFKDTRESVVYLWIEPSGGAPKLTPRVPLSRFKDKRESVVYLSTLVEKNPPEWFNMDAQQMELGTGSGIVWDNKGHIVTNYHLVRMGTSAQVTVMGSDGASHIYPAKLTGIDPDKDIAVLQIDAAHTPLKPIRLGSSREVEVGQAALAIGNPFGLDHTLTSGVVSGLGRSMEATTGRTMRNLIQTDAAVNPGNSGGPLLDSSGRMIGMNTAIFSASGMSAGVGFAIPADTIRGVADRLIKYGVIVRPVLGITFLDGAQARLLDLPNGVLVLSVPPGSPAAKAGMQGTSREVEGIALGDIIVGVEGAKVEDEADLFDALENHKPGDTVTLTVLRDGVPIVPTEKGVINRPPPPGNSQGGEESKVLRVLGGSGMIFEKKDLRVKLAGSAYKAVKWDPLATPGQMDLRSLL